MPRRHDLSEEEEELTDIGLELEGIDEAQPGYREAPSSPLQRLYYRLVLSHWNRLSKNAKTGIIIAITALIVLALMVGVLVPITRGASYDTRHFYLQAEQIQWDYVQQGRNLIQNRSFTPYEQQFTLHSDTRIGSEYTKAVFRGYTDATFTTRLPDDPAKAHMGLLGPVVRGEVGQKILVTVSNTLSFPISFHIRGLENTKMNEGIPYNDGIKADHGAKIAPGANYTYVYELTEADGPAVGDSSSVARPYYSAVDSIMGINTGLVGIAVVARRGASDADAVPLDVDAEAFIMASVIDENQSYYFDHNAEMLPVVPQDSSFYESNRKASFNGYMYGNMPPLVFDEDARVRWYVCNLAGTSHTLSWSGQSISANGHLTTNVVLAPGTKEEVDSTSLESGVWILDAFGIDAKNGMATLFKITSHKS